MSVNREGAGMSRVAGRRLKWEEQWQKVGGLDGKGRDGPVVITRDEIVALGGPLSSCSCLCAAGPWPVSLVD